MVDLGYLFRSLGMVWKYRGRGKGNQNLFGETVLNGRCWPSDLDINLHMNNSRYLRECDFGRISYLIETGLWDVCVKRRKSGYKHANLIVSACQVQYRQSIELGDRFQLRTRLNGWDEKAFYFEQSITLDKNEDIAFLVLVRLALIPRSLKPQDLIDDLNIGTIQSPPLSQQMENFKQNYKLNLTQQKAKL